MTALQALAWAALWLVLSLALCLAIEWVIDAMRRRNARLREEWLRASFERTPNVAHLTAFARKERGWRPPKAPPISHRRTQ